MLGREPPFPLGPEWEPLVDLAGHEAVRWFQYLIQFETADGTPLWMYRHWAASPGYLFIDDGSQPWTPIESEVGGFRRHTSAEAAIEDGWPRWWLERRADPLEVAAAQAAIERARRDDAAGF